MDPKPEIHTGKCFVCTFPLDMPALPVEGDLFTCAQCGTVNHATGYGQRVTTQARHALYVKYDGNRGRGDLGLTGAAKRKYDDQLLPLLKQLDSGKITKADFEEKRVPIVEAREIELRKLRNAKEREMRPLRKKERQSCLLVSLIPWTICCPITSPLAAQ